MCGRYHLNLSDPNKLRERFHVDTPWPTKETVKTRYNIAPSETLPVVVTHSPNHIEMMVWGLVPFWEKSDNPHTLINMRDDTIIEKKWAHTYIQFQRCIVPASGFFEWKRVEKGLKIPYRFYVKDEEYFGMAGVYSIWKHPQTGKEIQTYSILTTSPNELMEPVHNRMPVILQKDQEDDWLNPDMVEIEHIKQYLKPFPANKMEKYPISTAVNNPSNDNEDVIKPISTK